MRLLKLFAFICLLAAFSCKKDSDSVDFTPNFYFINGGSASFSKNLILFSSADTVTFNIVVSSTYLLSKNATVTIGVADEYRVSYNTANGTNYATMPAAAYSFEKTFTAGTTTVYDTIPVKILKNLLLTDNYLLPIKILSADNNKIDSAGSIIYLNTNSNALSGIYVSALTKKIYTGDASDTSLEETLTDSLNKSLIPLNKDSSLLDYADLGGNGWKYILSYDVNGAGFEVKPNSIIEASVKAGSFEVLKSVFIPSSKDIYIKTRYKNLSGDERIVEETLTLQ